MNSRRRVAVLISGRGSNMLALIQAARRADFPADIVQVISDRADAGGIALAAAAGVKTDLVSYRDRSKAAAEADILHLLSEARIEIVCLAGFMRILSPDFVSAWHNRLINIHPSLLPDLTGLNTHQRAIDAGLKQHGCSVHFVRAAIDSGPVIAQAVVPVKADDTPEILSDRVQNAEHRIYPLALALIAGDLISVELDRIRITGHLPPAGDDIRIVPYGRG